MVAQRRKNKGAVFGMLPSFVTADNGPDGTVSRPRRKLSSEALREIIMVVVGLAVIAFLFLSGSSDGGGSQWSPGSTKVAGRPVVNTPDIYIVPPHLNLASKEGGVKKAPSDKQRGMEPEVAKGNGPVPWYRFIGDKSPRVVVVTIIDDVKYPREYWEKIVENRLSYAKLHGYGVIVRLTSDYAKFIDSTSHQTAGWARIAVAREAMESFPKAKTFWFIDQNALIMNPQVDIVEDFVKPENLESKMLRNVPVQRDSGIIRTYVNNRASDVSLIFSRDESKMSTNSFVYKNSLQTKAFFETVMDPLFRGYRNFWNEADAINHVMQWHTYFLMHAAIVNPKLLASYATPAEGQYHDELQYTDGDFTVMVKCDYATEACKKEFMRYWNGRGGRKGA